MAKKIKNPYDDKVAITLIPPSQDDEGKTVYISVGDYHATAKYGEEIVVPRFVVAMLQNQKMAIADRNKNEAKRRK